MTEQSITEGLLKLQGEYPAGSSLFQNTTSLCYFNILQPRTCYQVPGLQMVAAIITHNYYMKTMQTSCLWGTQSLSGVRIWHTGGVHCMMTVFSGCL